MRSEKAVMLELAFFIFLIIFLPSVYSACPGGLGGSGTPESPCNVTNCTTLSLNNYYRLNQSVNISAASPCIALTSNNLILDGGGFLMNNTGLGTYGISSSNRNNITIKNFKNITGFTMGIYFSNTDNSLIQNVSISSGSVAGIYLTANSDWNNLENLVFNFLTTGLTFFTNSKNNNITNISANFNDAGAIINSGCVNNTFDGVNMLNNNDSIIDLSFSAEPDKNFFVQKNNFGEIKWTSISFVQNLTLSKNITFPGTITISNNSAYVNSSAFSGERINSSANITFYGISPRFIKPKIFRDSAYECNLTTYPSCFNFTELNASVVIFNVSSWSEYRIMEGYSFCPANMNGLGTFANPCIITNCSELNSTRLNLTISYALNADINFSSAGCSIFQSGAGWDPIETFNGNFSGKNHTIYNLVINRPTEDYAGLFAALNSRAEVYDLGLVNVTIAGANYAGALTGDNDGNISKVFSSGSVNGSINVGGISGSNDKAVINCYSSVDVYASTGNAGGLVGVQTAENSEIYSSYSSGNVTGTINVGGLLGSSANSNNFIIRSFSVSRVFGTTNVGGVVGQNSRGGTAFDAPIGAYWYNWTDDNASNCYSGGSETCTSKSGTDISYFKGDVYDSNYPFQNWDFTGTWDELEENYPVLTWQNIGQDFTSTLCPSGMPGNGTINSPCNISACGTITTPNMYYSLINNLSASGTCINVVASNITLNGMSYSIKGSETGYGIYVQALSGPTRGRSNVIIKNFASISNTSSGIFLYYTVNSTIENCNLTKNSRGIDYYQADNLVLNNNRAYNNTQYNIYGSFLILFGGGFYGNSFSYNNTFGTIDLFTADTTFALSGNLILGDSIIISNNSAYVNSATLSDLNVNANITLRGIGNRGFANPAILKDGAVCSGCVNFTALTEDTVKFSVQSWSTYTLGETPSGTGNNGGSGSSCIPKCSKSRLACGDDGCGGSCGTCGSGLECYSGTCIFICSDDCTLGNKKCLGNGYSTCGNYDSDRCTEWGVSNSCSLGESCQDGSCVSLGEENNPEPNIIPEYIPAVSGGFGASISCDSDFKCGNWSSCSADYNVEDLINKKDIQGKKFRLCSDENKCLVSFTEEKICSVKEEVDVDNKAWCNQEYTEVKNKITGSVIARLNILPTGKAVNIYFNTENEGYCKYCFDRVKNYDETGVDCGGSCISCENKKQIKTPLYKTKVFKIGFSALIFMFFLFSGIYLSREIIIYRKIRYYSDKWGL